MVHVNDIVTIENEWATRVSAISFDIFFPPFNQVPVHMSKWPITDPFTIGSLSIVHLF